MRIPAHRLDRQLVARQRFRTPAEVVAWLGAMQAQDYLAALWGLGLRTPKSTEATIETAIADGSVIRTHVFRGTWQYVAREDVRWMLGLVGARVIASAASRLRELELDRKTLKRCGELFAKALAGGRQLTRKEMAEVLARARIRAVNRRLFYILWHAELDGVTCSGARRGKQSTFALMDDRVPKARALTRETALAGLATRYFRSRGPATARDFAWWSGLTLGEARQAVALAGTSLESTMIHGEAFWFVGDRAAPQLSPTAHLLPAFDEYLVGYQNRNAVIDPVHARKVNNAGGILKPAVVIDGRVAGIWGRTLARETVAITVRPFGPLTRPERDALADAAARYGRFLGLAPRLLG